MKKICILLVFAAMSLALFGETRRQPEGVIFPCGGEKVQARALIPSWYFDNEFFQYGNNVRFNIQFGDGFARDLEILILTGSSIGETECVVDREVVSTLPEEKGPNKIRILKLSIFGDLAVKPWKMEFQSRSAQPAGAFCIIPKLKFTPITADKFLISSHTYSYSGKWDEIKKNIALEESEEIDRTYLSGMWQPAAKQPDRTLNLGPAVAGNMRYAVTHIYTEKVGKAVISVGADYFWKFRLNGKIIEPFYVVPGGSGREDCKRYPVELNAGWNELRFKFGSGSSGFFGWVSVCSQYPLTFSTIPEK